MKYLKAGVEGLIDLFSGKKAQRSKARREALKTSLQEAGKTNKTASEAYGQVKAKKHWTAMTSSELAEQGAGSLVGGLAAGGDVKAFARPNVVGQKVGKMLGKGLHYAINAPGAPSGLSSAADAAMGLAQGQDMKQIGLNMAFDQVKDRLLGSAMQLAPNTLGTASQALGLAPPSSVARAVQARPVTRLPRATTLPARMIDPMRPNGRGARGFTRRPIAVPRPIARRR